MSRKMKNFSAKIILDFVAFLAMSAAYLVGRAVSGSSKDRDRMI
jgi:hypothetical protein